ncbi:MAG TPA: hypothetical protein VII25_11540, partial [Candidatus Acidoferrum sp.]
MTKLSRHLLTAMSLTFGICILGLVAGMLYYLCAVYLWHRTLENVIGNSIIYNKTLGAIGVLGFILFLAFLVSLMAKNNSG